MIFACVDAFVRFIAHACAVFYKEAVGPVVDHVTGLNTCSTQVSAHVSSLMPRLFSNNCCSSIASLLLLSYATGVSALSATMYQPYDVVQRANGDILFSDSFSNVIRVASEGGVAWQLDIHSSRHHGDRSVV